MVSMDKVHDLKDSFRGVDLKLFVRDVRDRLGRKRPIPTLPLPALYGIASFGTILKKTAGIEFPLTLFRLGNMLTEMHLDTDNVESIAGDLPYSNEEAVQSTLEWLKHHEDLPTPII